ncbi:sigma-70 family RNA polymerase sigma factor [Paenibacillus sp. BJ-4]|uniref:sigma-70 family RNA polymerase sigma factor n=1 Tax=Paenibacillus sp. BJ-4 TaxID=2878097 RepID=UPI001CEFC22D|nr:sigma-70 family RNA polymerase sigma factor [Paenibacillus sp. BJ-4]
MTVLVAETLAGSREAYRELYDYTIHTVYRSVHFLLEEKADADDVVQEIYIQVYRSLGQFDVNRSFQPWLMGIVMRQIRAYRRKRWMRLRITSRAERLEYYTAYDFSEEIVDKVANHALLHAVQQLSFKLKQVIVLHYLHEYSQEEISNILEIPLGTVKSRIHAALQKLRSKEREGHFLIGKVEKIHEA